MSDPRFPMTRRQLMQAVAGGAAVLAGACAVTGGAQTTHGGLPLRRIGATGLRASILGIGTGTHGWNKESDQTRLGRAEFVALLEHAYDEGVTYYDMADQYGSHTYVREALRENGGSVPRDRVFLLTKSRATDYAGMKADLDRFRQEIGTDVIDAVLLHCMMKPDWTTTHAGAMDALAEAKEKGVVRAHGVSCHNFEALKVAADSPWVDVDLARFNPWGAKMDAPTEEVRTVLQKMKDDGKGVIGMKILAEGTRASKADIAQSMAFARTNGILDVFTIGMTSREQLAELKALCMA